MAILKRFCIYLWFVIVMVCTMVLLMWGVYSISIEKIKPNAVKSAETISVTPVNSRKSYKIPGMYFDTWTDSRMINMASFLGQYGAFKDSLLAPRMHYDFIPYINVLCAVKSNNTDGGEIRYYPRFWQGWLIFLKPLLIFFDLAQIRIINGIVQLMLLMFVLFLMYKKLGIRYCLAFVTSILFLNPVNSWKCLEFATDVNIMLLASLWVLLNKNPHDNYMFFIIGIVTISFDWLTYPLITLGIPLIIYILLHKRNFKDNIKCVVKNSFLWLLGYALMWSSKWGVATIFTEENILNDVLSSILHRSYGIWPTDGGLTSSDITYSNAIIVNFKQIFCEGSFYYIGCFIASMLIYYVFKPFKFIKNIQALIILGIGCMPFVWYAVLINHSVHHSWMAHKILVITIYAVLSAVVCCLTPKVKR